MKGRRREDVTGGYLVGNVYRSVGHNNRAYAHDWNSSAEQRRAAQSSAEQRTAAQSSAEQRRAAQSSAEQRRAVHSSAEQRTAAQENRSR